MSKNSRRKFAVAALTASLAVSLLSPASATPTPNPDKVGQCNITVLETRMASPVLKSVFGTALLEGFAGSDFGRAWEEGEAVRENVLTPADVTGVEGSDQRVATLALWPGMESLPEATSSVNEFYSASRASLDALGRAVFSDYDVEAPLASKSLKVRESLAGTQSEDRAVGLYDEAYRRVYHLKKTVGAAGYPDAEWSSDSISMGDFQESATDWEVFVASYSNLSEANRAVAALPSPSFDLVHKVVAPDENSGIAPSLSRLGDCYQ